MGTFSCLGGIVSTFSVWIGLDLSWIQLFQTALFLPETLFKHLPNTLEEGETFGTNFNIFSCPSNSRWANVGEKRFSSLISAQQANELHIVQESTQSAPMFDFFQSGIPFHWNYDRVALNGRYHPSPLSTAHLSMSRLCKNFCRSCEELGPEVVGVEKISLRQADPARLNQL